MNCPSVLIETLWNVNPSCTVVFSHIQGINRNIVECKFLTGSPASSFSLVLIETLWNVNKRQTTEDIIASMY